VVLGKPSRTVLETQWLPARTLSVRKEPEVRTSFRQCEKVNRQILPGCGSDPTLRLSPKQLVARPINAFKVRRVGVCAELRLYRKAGMAYSVSTSEPYFLSAARPRII